MNMKKLLAMLLATVMILGLCACGGNNEATEATQATEATEATTEATEATTEATEETEPAGTVYKVKVQDENGNPVAGVMVQICFETCLPAMTNAEGVAEYHVDEAEYKVSFLMVPDGYAEDLTQYYFEDGAYEMTLTLKAAE